MGWTLTEIVVSAVEGGLLAAHQGDLVAAHQGGLVAAHQGGLVERHMSTVSAGIVWGYCAHVHTYSRPLYTNT